jgi:hypothetical protein
MRTETEKKPYTPPKLIVYGGVEAITQGGSQGQNLDAGFPVGTPFNGLTFS